MGNRGYSKFYGFIAFWSDIIIFNVILLLLNYVLIEQQGQNGYQKLPLLILALNAIWLLISILVPPANIFEDRKLSLLNLFAKELIRVFLLVLGYVILAGLFDVPLNSISVLSLLLFTLWLILSRILVYFSVTIYRSKGYNFRNIVIIVKEGLNDSLMSALLNQAELGYRLQTIVKAESLLDGGKRDEFMASLRHLEIDEVFIQVENLTETMIDTLLEICDTAFVKVRLVSDIGLSLQRTLQPENINNVILMEVSPFPLENPLLRLSKRLFDIFFSLAVLLFLLSWLTPVIAILIALESRGPVIFKQRRTGVRGEEFACYKFRTMVVNNEAESQQVILNDKRVTKLGKFLRASSLDELPQFYNVLMGDMSTVGPRPHMIHHTKLFSQKVRHYFNRHYVKPGITGLAQVEGYRGEIATEEELEGRILLDRRYVENWTFMLDLKIIMKTMVQVVASHSKAY